MNPTESQGLNRFILAPPTENHTPLPASGRAGRNLPAAVASGVILIVSVGVALVFARPFFIGLIVVFMLVATWEVAGAFARKGRTVVLPPIYVGGTAMIIAGATFGPFWVMAILYFTFALIVIWRLANQNLGTAPISDVAYSVFTVVYIPFNASFVALISAQSVGVWPIVFFVVIVACNDLGGWMAGVLFGRHPMAPKLSPKKSWEGFAGSVALSVIAGIGGALVMNIPWWNGIIFGIAGAVLGTLGDLLESLIKRDVGLKDMSSIVPGHGGLMDRLDSILFAAPAFYFAFALALGWPL